MSSSRTLKLVGECFKAIVFRRKKQQEWKICAASPGICWRLQANLHLLHVSVLTYHLTWCYMPAAAHTALYIGSCCVWGCFIQRSLFRRSRLQCLNGENCIKILDCRTSFRNQELNSEIDENCCYGQHMLHVSVVFRQYHWAREATATVYFIWEDCFTNKKYIIIEQSTTAECSSLAQGKLLYLAN